MNFSKLPLNTQKSYCMVKDESGCEIYIPVDSRDNGIIEFKKKVLKKYLDIQPEPPLIMA